MFFMKGLKGPFQVISFSGSGIRLLRGAYLSNPPRAYMVVYEFLPADLVLNFLIF